MYQEYLNQLQVSIAPLSLEELKELLNDDDKVEEKVEEVLIKLVDHKDEILTDNRKRAEKNIEKEPQIVDLRCKVNELLKEGKQSCETVQEKLGQIKEKAGNVSQETVLALLQAAAAESEEESEALVKSFTDAETGVEAFLEGFLVSRKTMHLRKLKAEKMQELIRRQSQELQRGPGNAYNNYPASAGSGFYPTPNAGIPYPIRPAMPMPPPRPY